MGVASLCEVIRIKPGVFILFVSHLKITNRSIPIVNVLSLKSLGIIISLSTCSVS